MPAVGRWLAGSRAFAASDRPTEQPLVELGQRDGIGRVQGGSGDTHGGSIYSTIVARRPNVRVEPHMYRREKRRSPAQYGTYASAHPHKNGPLEPVIAEAIPAGSHSRSSAGWPGLCVSETLHEPPGMPLGVLDRNLSDAVVTSPWRCELDASGTRCS